MNVSVVRIGNSRGLRIPKEVLDRCRFGTVVELRVSGSRIILEPLRRRPREGWAEAARDAHAAGDDALLIPDVLPDDPVLEPW